MTPWTQPQRLPVRLCPVLLCTESDGSSVHTPDTTCAFRHGTPDAFTINDSNAEAFAALSFFFFLKALYTDNNMYELYYQDKCYVVSEMISALHSAL